jgi:hypothetical protein
LLLCWDLIFVSPKQKLIENQITKYIQLLNSVRSAETAADKRTEADAAFVSQHSSKPLC